MRILTKVREESGQAVVEMALVLPLLLLLILGLVEFGWILNGEITLTAAAREGARTAIVYESSEKAQAAVQSAVSSAANSSSLHSITTTTEFVGTQKAIVVVNATITPIIGFYVQDDMPLEARAEMRLE